MAEEEVAQQRAIVTRAEAKAAGLKRYFTGVPCAKGHISERRSSTSNCIECQSKKSAERYLKHRDHELKKSAERYVRDRAKVIARSKAWAEKNREKKAAQSAKYRERYPEKMANFRFEWLRNNPDWVAVKDARRRARKLASNGRFTASDVKYLFGKQRGSCAWCKTSIRDGYHVDHVIPLAKGGSNVAKNIVLSCASCNTRKSSKDPLVWARQLGMLL